MKKNKANREDFNLRIEMWVLLLLFWGMIICQIFKVTKLSILCIILYSIINIHACYRVLKNPKDIIEGFVIMEAIPLIPIGIIAIIQAII